MTNWAKNDLGSVVAVVQIAKRNGVESYYLYKYMTQALYFLGDFGTSMQGFKKIEDLGLKKMGAQKPS